MMNRPRKKSAAPAVFPSLDRRSFCSALTCSALTAGSALAVSAICSDAAPAAFAASPQVPGRDSSKRFYKAVKWGMIQIDAPPLDKFQLCKELGFDGMELESPVDATTEELLAAARATQMPIHGLVDMKHWELRLSSPDEAVRQQGREFLEQGIRDSKTWSGSTVLLVPGKVTGDDETHDHVWKRSITEIRKVLPLASRLGIRILIENVWNGFCETPELLRDYLDEIESPWVGAYLDIGNVRKFGPSEDWVRVLGKHTVKLDIKDWGKSNGFCKIGDGDVNWPAVCEALAEIDYSGWCTAEVKGGGRERLADISARMDRVLVS